MNPLPTEQWIGAFKIIQRIGEGGFGLVFEAEQGYPVQRRVALKVIKLGMDTREVIARFETERQVLALMDHPHVARVFDAGTSEDGRPYFAMELVQGQPITAYCAQHALPLVARLKLFDQVCQAVQHAHTKGVIHRDLKPSNVLVATHDAQPFAKVIDFGIAKAISGNLREQTLVTHTGLQMLGTPRYMSPEQAEGSADIDTRTDIYALGVLLYELLTGSTPCQVDALKEVEQRKFARMLRGELDWIVMKALESDRERRYETATALAADVARYLSGQSVLAAPPSAFYRISKIVRRHKAAVTVGVLLVLFLAGGLLSFAWQARIASQRAAELEQVAKFQAEMLAQVDPTQAGKLLSDDVLAMYEQMLAKAGRPAAEQAAQRAKFLSQWQRLNATDAARNLLDRTMLKPAAQAINRQFQKQPLVAATLRQVLADRYFDMGLYGDALPLQQSAYTTRRRLLGEEHPETLQSIDQMGDVLQAQGKLDAAEPYYRLALDKRRQVLGEEHPETLASIGNVGFLLLYQGKLHEAEPYYRDVLAKRRRVLGEEHPDTLTSIASMGALLQYQGRLSEAEPFCREALDKARRTLGEDSPDTLRLLTNLGALLRDQGKLDEAGPYFREAMAKRRQVLGEAHPDTLISINSMASVLVAQHKPQAALELLTPIEAATRKAFTDANAYRTAKLLTNLGKARTGLGQYEAAGAYLLEAYGMFLDSPGPSPKDKHAAIQAVVELYLARQASEPDKGFAAKARAWQLALSALKAAQVRP